MLEGVVWHGSSMIPPALLLGAYAARRRLTTPKLYLLACAHPSIKGLFSHKEKQCPTKQRRTDPASQKKHPKPRKHGDRGQLEITCGEISLRVASPSPLASVDAGCLEISHVQLSQPMMKKHDRQHATDRRTDIPGTSTMMEVCTHPATKMIYFSYRQKRPHCQE